MASTSLPSNIHLCQHPCLRAKLSLLRSSGTNARDSKSLVHEISLILGCEALSTCLSSIESGIDKTPLGHEYNMTETTPSVTLVPILRSGLGMLEAFQTLLTQPVPVHHLGLYREPTTLEPVEYYNNLPYHAPSTTTAPSTNSPPPVAILLDPVIATGGTASAAIQTLLEWGVKKVVLVSIIANDEGIRRAAAQTHEGEGEEGNGGGEVEGKVEVWVGAVDEGLNDQGMIKPGLGDIGDRLFGTLGK